MSKVTLQDITSGYSSTTKINANNDTLETAFDNTLSRDGSSPNTMSATLDMNSKRILNLGSPESSSDAARWADVTSALAISTALPSQTGNANKAVFTDGSNLSFRTTPYIVQTAAESAAGVTPTNYYYEPGNVLRYGSNTTPGTTDMTTAIQAAINSNASVYVPAGTYLVGQLNAASNQVIYGDGPASIVKLKVVSQFVYTILVSSKTGVTIRDLQLDGNGAAQPVGEHIHGVNVLDSTDVSVRNCTFHDFMGDCLYVESTSDPVLCDRITFTENVIYNLGRDGITIAGKGVRRMEVIGNIIRTGTYVTGVTTKGNCIHFECDTNPAQYIGDIVVNSNECLDTGITFSGLFNSVIIANNIVRTPKYVAVPYAIAVFNSAMVAVVNNIIQGDNTTVLDGIYVQDSGINATTNVKEITVKGNTIDSVAGHGIIALGTGSGVPALGQISICDNMIRTGGTGGTKQGITIQTNYPDALIANNNIKTVTGIGIQLNGVQGFTIAGNKIAECGGTFGIYMDVAGAVGAGPGIVTGNTVRWAAPAGKTAFKVENTAANTRVQVFGNDFSDSATSITFGGAATKCSSWGNVGGSDALTGSFTLAAAVTTTVNNANILATSRILLVPTNAAAATLMGSAKALYVSARTAATSFAVSTASAVAAAGTETFDYWISV